MFDFGKFNPQYYDVVDRLAISRNLSMIKKRAGKLAKKTVALYSPSHDKSKKTVKQWILAQWILHDPDHKHVASLKPLFRAPDGSSADNPVEAQVFQSEADAKKIGDKGPVPWTPRRLSEFWP
jgi:hypothetical protein